MHKIENMCKLFDKSKQKLHSLATFVHLKKVSKPRKTQFFALERNKKLTEICKINSNTHIHSITAEKHRANNYFSSFLTRCNQL